MMKRLVLPALALLWLAVIWVTTAFAISGGMVDFATEIFPAGSTIESSRMPLGERLRFETDLRKGTRLTLPVLQHGRHIRIVVAATHPHPVPVTSSWLSAAGATIALLFLAYLGYRLPGIMIGGLIFYIGGDTLGYNWFNALITNAPDWLYVPLDLIVRALCDFFPLLALASFAARFPGEPLRGKHRIAVRCIDACALAGFVASFWVDSVVADSVAAGISALLVIVSCVVSLRYASALNRARTGIVFVALMLGAVGYACTLILFDYHLINIDLLIWYGLCSAVVVPLAITYAIVRHRVLDLSFVLNRTVIFALTSAIVLLVLAALELVAERFITQLTHLESVAIQFAIAMAMIVSFRLVHARVDRLVDSLLFRARHEQEIALHRFATAAQFYTTQGALIRDALDAMTRYARVTAAAAYVAERGALERRGSTFAHAAERIDENDPAHVMLRAYPGALDLHGIATAFPGERLYPLVLAGSLQGVLAIAARENGEAMPPDIDEAIRQIAAAAAITLAAIETSEVRLENARLKSRLAEHPA